jgi:hypothetical protein
MTSNEPEIRRSTIRLPNLSNVNPEWVQRAATQEAQASLANDDRVFDLQLHGGRSDRHDNDVMVWAYSFQVIKPGMTQVVTRPR